MQDPEKFVEVVVTATKQKQYVPRHFLDHPVLSRGIELPPSAREAKKKTPVAAPVAEETPNTGDNEIKEI